jgi:uncharacterized protein (TIGR04255 family)
MEPRYQKPFIKEAIVRVDFAPPLELDDKTVENSFAAAVQERFPNLEPRVQVGQEFVFGPDGMSQKKVKSREWQVFSESRDRRILLAPGALVVGCTEYTHWDDLKGDFVRALDAILADHPTAQVTRLGVRYINSISLQQPNPFNWTGLIADSLTSVLTFPENPKHITRSMHVLELEYPDDVRLKFQFGVPNPDHPAPVKQKHFVLDLDASTARILEIGEVKARLDPMHAYIKELFEDSIGDDLRDRMGRVDE